MKSEKFLLDIQTKCVDIANKILNLAIDTERTLKCKWPNGQTYLKNKEVEPVEPVQMYMYQSNTYRKDLSWLHFNNEPRVQEKQQVKDQQSCIFVFVACLTIPSSNQGHQPRRDNSIPYMGIWQIYRDREQPQEKEASQNESKLYAAVLAIEKM